MERPHAKFQPPSFKTEAVHKAHSNPLTDGFLWFGKYIIRFLKILYFFRFSPFFFFLKKERRAKAAKVNWQKNAWSRLSWKSRGSVCAHLFAKPSYSHTQKDLWNSRKTGLATCFSTDTSKTSSCGQVWRRQDLLGLPAVKPKTRECAWRDSWSKSD